MIYFFAKIIQNMKYCKVFHYISFLKENKTLYICTDLESENRSDKLQFTSVLLLNLN